MIDLVITKITYDELIKHINLKAKDIKNSYNVYLKKLTVYKNIFPKSNFGNEPIDHQIIAKELKSKLDESSSISKGKSVRSDPTEAGLIVNSFL